MYRRFAFQLLCHKRKPANLRPMPVQKLKNGCRHIGKNTREEKFPFNPT